MYNIRKRKKKKDGKENETEKQKWKKQEKEEKAADRGPAQTGASGGQASAEPHPFDACGRQIGSAEQEEGRDNLDCSTGLGLVP